MYKKYASKVTAAGTITIPAVLRRKYNIEPGDIVIFESREDGILLIPMKVKLVPATELIRKKS